MVEISSLCCSEVYKKFLKKLLLWIFPRGNYLEFFTGASVSFFVPHSESNKAQRLGQNFKELFVQGAEARIVVSRIEPGLPNCFWGSAYEVEKHQKEEM